MRGVAVRLALIAVLVAAAACQQQEKDAPAGAPVPVEKVQAVALADIARAEPAVQAQLRGQYATMTRIIGQASTTPAERAAHTPTCAGRTTWRRWRGLATTEEEPPPCSKRR